MIRAELKSSWIHRPATTVLLSLLLGGSFVLSLGSAARLAGERTRIRESARNGAADSGASRSGLERRLAEDALLLAVLSVGILAAGVLFAFVYRAASESRRHLEFLLNYSYDVLQSLGTGVVTIEPAGTITAINDRAARSLSLGPECLRTHHRRAFADLPVLDEHVGRLVVENREFSDVDMVRPRREGELCLRLNGTLLRNASGERIGFVVEVSDVTRIKTVEEGMRRAERLTTLGSVAAGIAHEIRNPLGAMSINLQLLEECLAPLPVTDRARRYLDVIGAETRRLNDTVEHFVRSAKPRPLERTRTSAEEILGSVLRLVEPECERQGVRVVRDGAVAGRGPLFVDEDQIRQALLNLLINAVQAMPGGGTLTLRLAEEPGFLRIDVGDTGPGIPEDDIERVFEPFYSTKKSGLGLGLPIAHRAVADHGGYLRARSRPGGTWFSVGLPADAPEGGTRGTR